ncbi:UNVERIFIED_CONTAM: hypothetical protein PYX00_007277 [Menopon gallinae]|uniref:RING-type domain-containing protein n=1 Tax=Menopon gallinae TaxID=328185 RepID=A0AAW2HIE2_9NEOP
MSARWQVRDILDRIYRPLLQTEQILLRMTHLYTIINQIVFFTLCDRAIGSNEKINSVYSLMLYNVIAYCLQYVKDMIEKEDWSPYVNVSQHSNVRHLAMTATKIVLEWTKAVTFLITIVFLVLTFSAREGLEKYHPTFLYTIFTLLHYGATEKTFFEMFPKFLTKLQLNIFESLEALWAPVILKLYTIVISAILVLWQIGLRNYRLAICGVYINVILCWKDADKNCFQELKKELGVLGKFKDATSKQLASFDDICSVCLCPMKAAKVTPCQHLFHADCLRRCLKTRGDCPICKRELISVQ